MGLQNGQGIHIHETPQKQDMIWRNHTDLINAIAKKINAYKYLEVGVFNPDNNFNKIEVPYKIGIDPDPKAQATLRVTSDFFFEKAIPSGAKMHLIWLDGLHEAEQLKRDAINAWNFLEPGGVVCIHDVNPHSEKLTCIPRGEQREWTGDVYKTVCNIQSPKFTVNFDYGVCVLRKPKSHEIGNQELLFSEIDITWERFSEHRDGLLKLISVDRAKEIIDTWT